MGRSVSLLFTIAFLAFGWMVFDNVYSDLAPIQQAALAVACTARSCDMHHGVTRVDRYFYGQTFEVSWRHPTEPVVVRCRRAYYVAGERDCRTQ